MMFEKVNFQTGECSYGTGIIVQRVDQGDRVKVLDEFGEFWIGSIEQIELAQPVPNAPF